jgi:hypothetical protein
MSGTAGKHLGDVSLQEERIVGEHRATNLESEERLSRLWRVAVAVDAPPLLAVT